MNANNTIPLSVSNDVENKKKVNWKQVGLFVGLTFLLTWSLDLVLYLNGGLTCPAVSIGLQLQMLLPAFSAMTLQSFFCKDSKLFFKTNRSTSRWFVWYFLAFTVAYIAAFFVALVKPYNIPQISSIMLVPGVLGVVLAIVLRLIGGKESLSSSGLGGGKPKYWILLGVALIAFLGLQTLLNWVFKLGQPVDNSLLANQAAMMGVPFSVLMALVSVQTIILGPFLGLLITLGEEYGWRGFLQPALSGIGRKWAAILVGVIWGAWHWPVIWMGYNYPGHPVLGSILFVFYCIILAVFLAFAMYKAKGVWIAAFLHALLNQTGSFFMGIIYTPNDMAFSFGIGIWTLLLSIPFVLWIFRDPVWKETD